MQTEVRMEAASRRSQFSACVLGQPELKRRGQGGSARVSLIVHKGRLLVQGFPTLPDPIRGQIAKALDCVGLQPEPLCNLDGTLDIPQFVQSDAGHTNLAPIFGRLLGYVDPRKKAAAERRTRAASLRDYPVLIDFADVCRRAIAFADVIESKPEALASILLQHESYEVVEDETARTLDLLRSLSENAEYFQRRIGAVATFLPRNQPLYALACFGLVPALMASQVDVKPPSSMGRLFRELSECLALSDHFPNVHFSRQDRSTFVRERAKRRADSFHPVTDAVIFTGTMANADKLRSQFDAATLFIANGSGHNPIVVAADADVSLAVAGVLEVQLYNSGQDCASPNSILVHRHRYHEFVKALRIAVAGVRVGEYRDRENRVGPLSDRKGLAEILGVFTENAGFLDPLTPGVVRGGAGIVEPTIMLKPLSQGGNFTEHFAPIFFVQCYEADEDLGLYFDDPRYAPNAMYVSVFGSSRFVEGLLSREQADGRPLHDALTFLRNTDPHAPGVERGTQPYGGYGRGASSVSLNGRIEPKPTLPQRDLFEYLVRPAIDDEIDNNSMKRPGFNTNG